VTLGPVTLLAVTLLAGACRGAASAPAPRADHPDSLYIGVAVRPGPTTESFVQGVALALETLNAHRPAEALPLALRLPAPTLSTQVAVAAAFRDDPRVVGVVGHTGSAQTLEAAPVYADVEHEGAHAVVAVTPTATNPAVTRASAWIFRVCPTDNDAARALASFIAESLATTHVGVVYRNDLFGRGFTRTVVASAHAHGISIVETDPYLADITAYDAYATRLVRRGVQAVVFAGGGDDVKPFIRALHSAGGNPIVLGSDDVGGLANDTTTAREFEGVRFTAFFLADRPATAQGVAFVQHFQQRFGTTPDHRAALAYDAAMLVGLAAHEVGPNRRAVRDRIASTGRDRPAYDGATGRIQFDEVGDVVRKPVSIGRIQPARTAR
jgi:branched-chain amino acid transport system substrate-binding protein